MSSKTRLILLAAVAAVAAVFLKRPVRPPATEGTWHPVDSTARRR